jgi:hypothetical protein
MSSTTFRGVIETAFENFVCLRGFATLGDLIDVSEPDKSYQRPLIDGRADELGDYLERGEYKFFPEVVLSANFNDAKGLDDLRVFLQAMGTKPQAFKADTPSLGIKLSSRYYAPDSKAKTDARVRERLNDGSLTVKDGASRLQRIDGNHRLSAAMSDTVRRYRVPFCIVLFGDVDQAKGFSRAVFHTINFKQRPMDMEHNLKLILDSTVENLALFPSDKLETEPSFGRAYVCARMLLPKINLQFLDALSNVLSSQDAGVAIELHRTFVLGLAQLFDGVTLIDEQWVVKAFDALKLINTIYHKNDSLRSSTNRGLLTAFVYLAFDSSPASCAKLTRFTDWIVRGHLTGLSEISPAALLNIFENLQTAKNRQVFVAMAFRKETEPTLQAIQDAIADVNRDYHLGLLPIKPIRIDTFDTWRSYKITDAIMEQIEECGLVIADLTYGNANVYHEIGYLFGLNTAQQRERLTNLILVWHKDRIPLDNEDKKIIEANDVRFDLKDWSAIRFSEPNALRKELVKALVQHYSPLNA